jgi:FMN phosphatase YigB (HAD superfamily)
MTAPASVAELKAALEHPSIKVVSFDILDTLFCRYVAFPRDLLQLYDDDFRSILGGFPLLSFSKQRFGMEDALRKGMNKLTRRREEITLDDIYAHIQMELGLAWPVVEALKAKELELERRHLRPRKTAVALLKAALEKGKTVALVSDMYLPEGFFKELLGAHGISGIDRIFVSSDLDKKKRTGSLFRHVLDHYEIRPEEMIHVGDNLSVDIEPARKLGLQAFHFPKALDSFLAMDGNRGLRGGRLQKADLGYRTVIGFVANRLFDDPFRQVERQSLANGDAYWMGYALYGPLMLFLAKWILEESILHGYEEVCFLARDGFILKDVYHQLAEHYAGAPKTNYIFSSRNVFLPWATRREDMIPWTHHYVGVHTGQLTFRKLLEERFRIELNEERRAFLSAQGFEDLDSPIGDRYAEFVRLIRHPKLGIVDANLGMVDLARDYYRQFFSPGKRQICFDIGWRGTSQLFLAELLGHGVDSFYLSCKSLAFENQYRYGFRVRPYAYFSSEFFIDYDELPLVLENVFGDPRSSTCIGFERTELGIVPVLSQDLLPEASQAVILGIQNGMRDFVREIMDWLKGDIRLLYAVPEHLFSPVLASILDPYPADREALKDIASENILMVGRHLRITEYWERKKAALPRRPAQTQAEGEDPSADLRYHARSGLVALKVLATRNHPRLTRSLLRPLYRVARAGLRPVRRMVRKGQQGKG